MPDYEGMILASQDARDIAEDDPDWDPALTSGAARRITTTRIVKHVIIVYGRSLSMEVIRNYPELEEIIGVIKRIADNLDEMTRIMQIKNPITMTPEKAKSVLNSMYGVMAANPLLDYDPEILRSEIHDLKLENDRLAKRDDKMRQVIRSIACDPDCEFCLLHGSECSASDMQFLAGKTLKELEKL